MSPTATPARGGQDVAGPPRLPDCPRLPELIALGLLALVVVTMTAVQTLVDAPLRRHVREVALAEQLAAETDQTQWRGQHL